MTIQADACGFAFLELKRWDPACRVYNLKAYAVESRKNREKSKSQNARIAELLEQIHTLELQLGRAKGSHA